MPKGEPYTPLTPPTPLGYIPPNRRVRSPDMAAKPEAKLVSTAAALAVADLAADLSPRGSFTDSDSCAEKVAELACQANRPAATKEV